MSLFDIATLDIARIEAYLDRADEMRSAGRPGSFADATVATAFFEKSTRTRLSFEMATRKLGANTLTFDPDSSSLGKGESLKDTAMTLGALGVDLLVVRHSMTGVSEKIATWTGLPVVSGGEGKRSHPTQTLLDLLTIRDRFKGFDGLNVGLIGDIANSRVARGLIASLPRLGSSLILIAPPTMLPATIDKVSTSTNLDDHLDDLDVVYLLRVQKERGASGGYPSDSEYRRRFGLTLERAASMRGEAVVMHPGPINRGVEVDGAVADGEKSLILDQVANGVPLRMAVLATELEARK